MSWFTNSFSFFWQRHLALLYGFSILLGVASALDWHYSLLIPIGFLIVSVLQMQRRFILALCLGCSAFLYVNAVVLAPQLPQKGISGTAYFSISSVASSTTHFGKRWLYKGMLKSFVADGSQDVIARQLPCIISIPQDNEIQRPAANVSYKIHGRLKRTSSGFSLVVLKDTPWYPLSGTWSLAEYRLWAKQSVTQYIHNHVQNPQAAAFLAGTATGDFDDRYMSFAFSRVGLQHIMAISGFHFTIIAGILGFLLRLVFRQYAAVWILLLLMSAYFLFLGVTPSILRAWITIVIVLSGFLLERHNTGLNSLGVALMLLPLLDPFCIHNLGFQLSFIITAAILMFYQASDLLLQKLFMKRPLSQMVDMDVLNQHGYCLLVMFRQAFAMMLAVNSIALPVLLYIFHKFPVFSFAFNIFFPFLVSLSMLLLILAFLFIWVPPIAEVLHWLNDVHTAFTLRLTYDFPIAFDVVWRISSFPWELMLCYIVAIFALGVCIQYYAEQRRQMRQDFLFL